MFGAISRWVKAVGYLLTGQLDAARRVLDTNPHVVRAKFDEIIAKKIDRIQQYKQAVSSLIAQQETKMSKVESLTKEVQNLERLKAGALAKAKSRVKAVKDSGKPEEDVRNDADYQKCLSAYNDFCSTLAEKQERIAELERDITEYGTRLKEHKVQLEHLVREIDQVRAEAADTVADMISAKQEKEIADAISGIGKDNTSAELQRMRELRHEVKAEARISKEIAGTDSRVQEAEFLEYARNTASNDEFDSLIGLAKQADVAPKENVSAAGEKSSLPE